MKKQVIHSTFIRMSSEKLLAKVSAGKMKKGEAQIVAGILERRFPTPKR
ncbi:MAG TPA: hypothetical protein VNT20_18290 [Flavisolibacter sp.]|jgi:hypothetical protein|nr:hypothetical protein [Flavisolibacter sp.]